MEIVYIVVYCMLSISLLHGLHVYYIILCNFLVILCCLDLCNLCIVDICIYCLPIYIVLLHALCIAYTYIL